MPLQLCPHWFDPLCISRLIDKLTATANPDAITYSDCQKILRYKARIWNSQKALRKLFRVSNLIQKASTLGWISETEIDLHKAKQSAKDLIVNLSLINSQLDEVYKVVGLFWQLPAKVCKDVLRDGSSKYPTFCEGERTGGTDCPHCPYADRICGALNNTYSNFPALQSLYRICPQEGFLIC